MTNKMMRKEKGQDQEMMMMMMKKMMTMKMRSKPPFEELQDQEITPLNKKILMRTWTSIWNRVSG